MSGMGQVEAAMLLIEKSNVYVLNQWFSENKESLSSDERSVIESISKKQSIHI